MDFLVSLILLVFGVLQIILFFKIWGMTNDVAAIKELLVNKSVYSSRVETKVETATEESQDGKFHVGQVVVHLDSEDQMKIMKITDDGKFACYTNGGSNFHGEYTEKEIEDFKTYWALKKGKA